MAGNRYLSLNTNGQKVSVAASQTSSGASSAGAVVALNASGQIDGTMMPSGVGATTVTATASAAISAGQLVNLYSNAGVLTAKPADNTSGAEANAFATAGVANSATGTFTLSGLVNGLSGLTVGTVYLLGVNGGTTTTAPTTSGYIIQAVGKAVSTSSIEFQPDYTISIS